VAEPIVEQEVADARRAFPQAQVLLAGAPISQLPAFVSVGWYDSTVHAETGAFALVREDGPYTDLVGEVIRVSYRARQAYVYVVGATLDLPVDLALYRRAFLELALLTRSSVSCVVEVIE
jgi:hypothetical protein